MKLTISKTFDFDAAHYLPLVPVDHKCGRLHGHTYRVEVVLSGELDSCGFIVDYEEISATWRPIHARIDHHVLNEVVGLENPTTEVLAAWLLEQFSKAMLGTAQVVRVRVYESSTTWCEASA